MLNPYFRNRTLIYFTMCIFIMPGATADAQTAFSNADWMTFDYEEQLMFMKGFIEEAKKDHVIIRLPAAWYVFELNHVIGQAVKTHNDKYLSSSFGCLVHTIAAMEGDWDNGENKLTHAQKWMGPDFEEFKTKFPDKYKKLLNDRIKDEKEGNKESKKEN